LNCSGMVEEKETTNSSFLMFYHLPCEDISVDSVLLFCDRMSLCSPSLPWT
jgi:hypothetical protein